MKRRDYAFPFRIDGASGHAAEAPYEAHVEQMIRQVLLTSPGERADLPDFGCGLRRMLFAPNTEALKTTAQLLVQQALDKWLSDYVAVQRVEVLAPDADEEQVFLRIEYVLLADKSARATEVKLV